MDTPGGSALLSRRNRRDINAGNSAHAASVVENHQHHHHDQHHTTSDGDNDYDSNSNIACLSAGSLERGASVSHRQVVRRYFFRLTLKDLRKIHQHSEANIESDELIMNDGSRWVMVIKPSGSPRMRRRFGNGQRLSAFLRLKRLAPDMPLDLPIKGFIAFSTLANDSRREPDIVTKMWSSFEERPGRSLLLSESGLGWGRDDFLNYDELSADSSIRTTTTSATTLPNTSKYQLAKTDSITVMATVLARFVAQPEFVKAHPGLQLYSNHGGSRNLSVSSNSASNDCDMFDFAAETGINTSTIPTSTGNPPNDGPSSSTATNVGGCSISNNVDDRHQASHLNGGGILAPCCCCCTRGSRRATEFKAAQTAAELTTTMFLMGGKDRANDLGTDSGSGSSDHLTCHCCCWAYGANANEFEYECEDLKCCVDTSLSSSDGNNAVMCPANTTNTSVFMATPMHSPAMMADDSLVGNDTLVVMDNGLSIREQCSSDGNQTQIRLGTDAHASNITNSLQATTLTPHASSSSSTPTLRLRGVIHKHRHQHHLNVDGEATDFTLEAADGATLRVHRKILAAHSQVFAAMFNWGACVRENVNGRLVMNEPDWIDGFLLAHFVKALYAMEIDNDSLVKFADGLMLLADKYAVDWMRIRCANHLLERYLNPDWAAFLLRLFDMVSLLNYKWLVMHFMASMLDRNVRVRGWPLTLTLDEYYGVGRFSVDEGTLYQQFPPPPNYGTTTTAAQQVADDNARDSSVDDVMDDDDDQFHNVSSARLHPHPPRQGASLFSEPLQVPRDMLLPVVFINNAVNGDEEDAVTQEPSRSYLMSTLSTLLYGSTNNITATTTTAPAIRQINRLHCAQCSLALTVLQKQAKIADKTAAWSAAGPTTSLSSAVLINKRTPEQHVESAVGPPDQQKHSTNTIFSSINNSSSTVMSTTAPPPAAPLIISSNNTLQQAPSTTTAAASIKSSTIQLVMEQPSMDLTPHLITTPTKDAGPSGSGSSSSASQAATSGGGVNFSVSSPHLPPSAMMDNNNNKRKSDNDDVTTNNKQSKLEAAPSDPTAVNNNNFIRPIGPSVSTPNANVAVAARQRQQQQQQQDDELAALFEFDEPDSSSMSSCSSSASSTLGDDEVENNKMAVVEDDFVVVNHVDCDNTSSAFINNNNNSNIRSSNTISALIPCAAGQPSVVQRFSSSSRNGATTSGGGSSSTSSTGVPPRANTLELTDLDDRPVCRNLRPSTLMQRAQQALQATNEAPLVPATTPTATVVPQENSASSRSNFNNSNNNNNSTGQRRTRSSTKSSSESSASVVSQPPMTRSRRRQT